MGVSQRDLCTRERFCSLRLNGADAIFHKSIAVVIYECIESGSIAY